MQKRLNDIIPNWLTAGSFLTKITALYDTPWEDETDISVASLDIEYHGNHSGQKIISPLVRAILGTSETLNDTMIASLCSVVWSRFGSNWGKLWDSLMADYNPIENYDMTETGSTSMHHSGTQNVDTTVTHGEQIDTASSVGATTETGIYGFNAVPAALPDEAVPAPADKETSSNNGQGQERHSGTTETDVDRTDNLTDAGQHLLTRHGNIGVTTSQQMIQSEIELRKADFFNIVFADLDKILTINIY